MKRLALLMLALLPWAAGAQAANTVTLGVSSVAAGNVPTLTWSAAWASQCTASGAWSGAKATIGTAAVAGVTSSSVYTLTCSAGADTTATLSWTAPTTNTDGSALTNLSGYNIYGGQVQASLAFLGQAKSPTTLTYVLLNQPAGVNYYAATAYNVLGLESPRSSIVSKTIVAGETERATLTLAVPNPPPLSIK